MVWFGLVFFFSGMSSVILSYSHLLNVLLSFEMMMVGLLGLLGWGMISMLSSMIFFMLFIVIMVGEGVLGLSLLIGLVMWSGEDMYMSVSCLKW